jgi:hypothetical protein
MNKVAISLHPDEVHVLADMLGMILTGQDIKELKTERISDYLVLSCLHELYNKLDLKSKELQAFGYAPGKTIRVSMKRHEALAFHLLVVESEYPDANLSLPAVPNEIMTLIRSINTEIHKRFLI